MRNFALFLNSRYLSWAFRVGIFLNIGFTTSQARPTADLPAQTCARDSEPTSARSKVLPYDQWGVGGKDGEGYYAGTRNQFGGSEESIG